MYPKYFRALLKNKQITKKRGILKKEALELEMELLDMIHLNSSSATNTIG